MSDVVLFVHSTGTGPAMWQRLAGVLPPGFEARAPANVGYPPGPFLARGTPSGPAEDLARLVEAVADVKGPLHVVGHSYGGMLAMHLAGRVAVASLWLVEPVLFGALHKESAMPPEAQREVDTFFGTPAFLDDAEQGGSDAWLEVFVDYWNKPGSWARLPASMRDGLRAMGWKMFQEVHGIARDHRRFEDYATTVPTTYVRGENTTPSARAMVDALAKVNAAARVEVLPGAAHMSIVTQPDKYAPSLLAHLDRVRR